MTVRAQFDQYELVIRQQAARIADLEEELERLKSNLDAHQTLRLIYTNPSSPEGNRIKAAAAAAGGEAEADERGAVRRTGSKGALDGLSALRVKEANPH